MSLQVWLPLNGNLGNQGLSGVTVNNNGAVVSDSGKIGKCYSFVANSLNSINFSDSTDLRAAVSSHSFSVCAWTKATANGCWLSITYAFRFWIKQAYIPNNKIQNPETNIVDGNWHHICYTHDEETLKNSCYVDGVLVNTTTGTGTATTTYTNAAHIGHDVNNTTAPSYFFNGDINDVRVYDHVLSAREVQEIAKGLVAHYTLSDYSVQGNKLYDSSGNGYESATIAAANLPVFDVDSPRRQTCMKFDSTAKYIKIENLPALGDIFSFSWWGYWTGTVQLMFWGYNDGNRYNIYRTGGKIYNNTKDSTSNPFYTTGTTVAPAPGLNAWTHYVLVGDGTSNKLYVNGELYATAKTFKPITGTTLYLHGWDASTSYKRAGTKLSDFRIYATALTTEQVKELYNNPISVCKGGTLMCSEITE